MQGDPPSISEQELASAAIAGEREALATLMACHIPLISRHIEQQLRRSPVSWSKPDVDDICQDVVLKACRAIITFRYAGDGAVWAWLRKIAGNAAKNWVRSRVRQHKRDLPRLAQRIIEHRSKGCPARRAQRQEAWDRLKEAAATLPPADRAVLQLRYEDGLMPSAIATMTGRTAQAVSMQIRRALNRLQEQMGAQALYFGSTT